MAAAYVRVLPDDGSASVTWAPGERAIWLKNVVPGRAPLLVGVTGTPSADLGGIAQTAILAGRPIRLPDLPSGYRWRVILRSVAEQPFDVCAAPLRP